MHFVIFDCECIAVKNSIIFKKQKVFMWGRGVKRVSDLSQNKYLKN